MPSASSPVAGSTSCLSIRGSAGSEICCKTQAAQSVWLGGVTPPTYQIGDPADACPLAKNGFCDEPTGCAPGTDTTDCENSCPYAFDGECDEGSYCAPGTDTADCDGPTTSCDALFDCACAGPCIQDCPALCQEGALDSWCMSCTESICPGALYDCFGSQ